VKSFFSCLVAFFAAYTMNTPEIQKTGFLQKYSYLIFGTYNVKHFRDNISFDLVQGTCFFIRLNGVVYLISAKHVLTPWDPDRNIKRANYPDTLSVRLMDVEGTYNYVPIDIKAIKDTITGDSYFNDPDVFVIRFDDTAGYVINSIEKFIRPFKYDYGDKLAMWGYPLKYHTITHDNFTLFKIQNSSLTTGTFHASSINLSKINYLMKRDDPRQKFGCSGSPVFLKSNEQPDWVFGGVFIKSDIANSDMDSAYRLSVIVRSKFVCIKLPNWHE
jgi:hypothetical protein